jgi:hypothetical protein
MQPLAATALEVGERTLRPWAKRHPWGLVLLAASVGAALAWGRPWRWLLRSALLASVASQLARRALASVPSDGWWALINAVLASAPDRAREAGPAAPDAAMPDAAAKAAAGRQQTGAGAANCTETPAERPA